MKWFFSLIKMGMTVIIVCLVSLMTTWYTVNLYVEEVLAKFNISTSEQKLQLSHMISTIALQAGLNDLSGLIPPSPSQSMQQEDLQVSPQREDFTSQDGNDRIDQLEEDDEALPVWSQSRQEEILVSPEQFMVRKNSMSEDEKWRVFFILVSRLPPEEMQKLSEIVEGGITEQGLRKLEDIVGKYVSQEEYEELLSILSKYE